MPEEQTTTTAAATTTATDGTTTAATQNSGGQGEIPAPETLDAWIDTLPEADRPAVTKLVDAHTSGLKSALDKERAERSKLEKEVRNLAKNADKGSELEKQLTEMADQLATANRAADFYQNAAMPGLGLSDPKAAWLIINATGDDFLDRRGNVNFEALKQQHPSLFKQPAATPRGNAGTGTGQAVPATANMNDFIRAGRGSRR